MSKLLVAVGSSDTILSVANDPLFPVAFGVILIGTEQISYEVNYQGTLYGCTRGYNSTSAASHSIGDAVTIFGYFASAVAGTGTVANGTQYQLAYYNATGNTVNGLTLITTSKALASDANGLPVASTTTSAELAFVHGVTSAIQTQINTLAPLASPTFTGTPAAPVLTLSNTTNQLVLGVTHTTTISATAPAASVVYTLPDAGGAANVLLDKGNYTLTGTWTNATLVTPALGTPTAGVLSSCTGLPLTTGVTGVLPAANAEPLSSAISSLAIDWNLSYVYTKTLGASSTFTFSNNSDGKTITVILTNTASNWTVTWPGGIKWSGGTAPTMSTGAVADVYTFVQAGSTIYGAVVQNLS